MKTVIFSIYFLATIFEIMLSFINMKHSTSNKATIPEEFRDQIIENDLEKSKHYIKDKTAFWIIEYLFKAFAVFFIVVFFSNDLDKFAQRVSNGNTIVQSLIFFLLIAAFLFTLNIPFDAYSTFVLEKRFGFSTTTFATYALDTIKSILIGLMIFLIILSLSIKMVFSVALWWIPMSIFVIALSALSEFIYPSLIIPLFYKFKPLDDESLKKSIESIADRVGFQNSSIAVMDASMRSMHTNAFFVGLGKSKRIVLFDTLLKNHSSDEIQAIFGHEAGHFKYKHILKSFLLSSVFFTFAIYCIFVLFNRLTLYYSYSFDIAFVYIFILVSQVYSFVEFVPNYISRSFEYEADRFAVSLTSKESMIRALKKVTKVNLSNLNPHPIYAFFKYTHPTPSERINAILKI